MKQVPAFSSCLPLVPLWWPIITCWFLFWGGGCVWGVEPPCLVVSNWRSVLSRKTGTVSVEICVCVVLGWVKWCQKIWQIQTFLRTEPHQCGTNGEILRLCRKCIIYSQKLLPDVPSKKEKSRVENSGTKTIILSELDCFINLDVLIINVHYC